MIKLTFTLTPIMEEIRKEIYTNGDWGVFFWEPSEPKNNELLEDLK